MEHNFLLLTVSLHKYEVKNNPWRKGKNRYFWSLLSTENL